MDLSPQFTPADKMHCEFAKTNPSAVLHYCMQLSMSYKVHSCNTVVIAKRCSGMYKKGLYLFREYSAGYRARLLACSHIPCLFILLSDFVAVRVLYQCVYGKTCCHHAPGWHSQLSHVFAPGCRTNAACCQRAADWYMQVFWTM